MRISNAMKKITAVLLAALLLPMGASAVETELTMDDSPDAVDVDSAIFEEKPAAVSADAIDIPAPSAILIEKETGTVLYEKNADEQHEPASVTKVMTMLLFAEAVESGALSLDDVITTSTRAASMGGSQVYLKEGEQMTASDMFKSIVVASANDCAVAVAEHLAGSEEAFVRRMNERAAELGMTNTYFTNCSGLMDHREHVTTARDIAIMSRELLKHEWVKEYTTIWMDSIRGGEFGLSNTNKLIYYYSGATGLKTGFTSAAGYCLSASAMRDGVEYIAVVMNCKTSTDRFESAKALLSFAFANYTLVSPEPDEVLRPIKVRLGRDGYVQPVCAQSERILVQKSALSGITRTVELASSLAAPVTEGQKVGTLKIEEDGTVLAEIDLVAADAVEKLSRWDIFRILLRVFLYGEK